MSVAFEDLLEVAHQLANAAAKVTLTHFRSHFVADNKSKTAFDPVTEADRQAELAMRQIITAAFPSHGVAGEEFEPVNENADYIWTLDPIDGTRAFVLGFPLWGTLIGVSFKGAPLLGVMDQPFTNERFWSDEKAAWHRGPRGLARCQTRAAPSLADAFLTASSPDMFTLESAARFDNLASGVRMRRFGGDCYAYCMLALGHIDIVAEASLKPYDIAPLIPIVEKAGGLIRAWDGGEATQGGNCVAIGNPALLSAVLERLGPPKGSQ